MKLTKTQTIKTATPLATTIAAIAAGAIALLALASTAHADVGWSKKDYFSFYGAPVKKMGQVSTAGETISVYVYQDGINNIVVAFDNSGYSITEVIAPTPE